MSKTTAVATLVTVEDAGDGQTRLGFQADYNDERNKEWAKYTPALSVQMTVLADVAERQFEQGETYLLTFKARKEDRDGRTRDRDHHGRRHEDDDDRDDQD